MADTALTRWVSAYESIHGERMAGLPICNDNLSVEAIGFRHWDGGFAGVLISPWFMNFVIFPCGNEEWLEERTGAKVEVEFPSGTYEFDTCALPELGAHLSLALFSTVHDFPDQETARQVADETARAIFCYAGTGDAGAASKKHAVSRRSLFAAGNE